MNEQDRATLSKEFKKFFSYFEGRGYSGYHHESKEMDLIGEYEEAVFYNSGKGRKLTLTYIESKENKAEVLSVYIENEVGDSFSIVEYLKAKSIPNERINALVIGNHLGDLSGRLSECLQMNIGVIDDYLKGIVFDQEWEAISVDWGDYK